MRIVNPFFGVIQVSFRIAAVNVSDLECSGPNNKVIKLWSGKGE